MNPAIRITEFVVFCLPFIKILAVTGDSCSRDSLSFSRTLNAQMAKGLHAYRRRNPSAATGSLHLAAGRDDRLHLKAPNYCVA